MTVTSPGRPVLTLVQPDGEPYRHGPRWWWFRVCEAAGTARWRILTAVATALAIVVPRVRAEAWAEGFTVALGGHPARTWRQHLDSWRQGNEVAHEIVYRRRGQAWDGRKFTLRRPLLVPDPASLSALAAQVAQEQLNWPAAARAQAAAERRSDSSGTACAPTATAGLTCADDCTGAGPAPGAGTAGGQRATRSATGGAGWRALRRIGPAVAVMATAAVAAGSQRVTALADVVATRRIVVIEGRHAATAGHPGRLPVNHSRPPGRHARTEWRAVAEGGQR
jgi:hypothetical protein